MTYGWVHTTYGWAHTAYGRRRWPTLLLLLLLLLTAARPGHARPAPASEITVTLLSAGPGALQAQGADGRALAVRIARATWVLRRGVVVAPRDLTPGETLRVRLGRGVGSAALTVCDAETAEAIDAHRRRPLACTVVQAGDKVWTVQPADGDVPLPVCLSARTTFRAGGSPVAASAFGAGAQVVITTRGLANGLLSAVSVSDAAPGLGGQTEAGGTPTPRMGSVSGVVVEARPDLGLLTLADGGGASRTVGVDAGTRVRSGGRAASLADLLPGRRVRVRLGAGRDAAGHPVAASVSASAAPSAKPAGKRKGR